MTLAKEHGLFVVENCAQLHGTMYKGRIGEGAFCQGKIMSTGREGTLPMTMNYGQIQFEQMLLWHQTRLKSANTTWSSALRLTGLIVLIVSNRQTYVACRCYVFMESSELKTGWPRDAVVQEINGRGVPCFFGSCSGLYLKKAFDETGWLPYKSRPVVKEPRETNSMFLVHPTLTHDEISPMCRVFEELVELAA